MRNNMTGFRVNTQHNVCRYVHLCQSNLLPPATLAYPRCSRLISIPILHRGCQGAINCLAGCYCFGGRSKYVHSNTTSQSFSGKQEILSPSDAVFLCILMNAKFKAPSGTRSANRKWKVYFFVFGEESRKMDILGWTMIYTVPENIEIAHYKRKWFFPRKLQRPVTLSGHDPGDFRHEIEKDGWGLAKMRGDSWCFLFFKSIISLPSDFAIFLALHSCWDRMWWPFIALLVLWDERQSGFQPWFERLQWKLLSSVRSSGILLTHKGEVERRDETRMWYIYTLHTKQKRFNKRPKLVLSFVHYIKPL